MAQVPLAGTAAAQQRCGSVNLQAVKDNTVVAHKTGGTTYGNRSGLIVLPSTADTSDYRQNLYIGKAENWTADIAIGDAGRCVGDKSDSTNLVSFHINADRLYDTGTKIARACTYWEEKKFKPHATGIFTVRIYGKLCDNSGGSCVEFRPGGADEGSGNFDCSRYNDSGYTTTFAPGPNCGPQKWPSRELRDAAARGQLTRDAALGYAEWCDFTVDGSRE